MRKKSATCWPINVLNWTVVSSPYSFEKYLLDLEDQVKHEADSNKIFCYVRDDAVPMRPGLNALKGSSHLSMYHNTRFEDSGMKVKKNYTQ